MSLLRIGLEEISMRIVCIRKEVVEYDSGSSVLLPSCGNSSDVVIVVVVEV